MDAISTNIVVKEIKIFSSTGQKEAMNYKENMELTHIKKKFKKLDIRFKKMLMLRIFKCNNHNNNNNNNKLSIKASHHYKTTINSKLILNKHIKITNFYKNINN